MKESRINIRATQELKDRLNKICELEHRSQAQMIEHWIMAYKLPDEKESPPEIGRLFFLSDTIQ